MAHKQPTLSSVSVNGFKSLWKETSIDISPLTVLAGANSSGKSSIMQPLLLLKQTLEAAADPGGLLLDGPNVRFTQADQLLSQAPAKTTSGDFGVKMRLTNGEEIELQFKREHNVGVDVECMSYTDQGEAFRLSPGMTHDDIIKVLPEQLKQIDTMARQLEESWKWQVHRERCFLSLKLGPFGSKDLKSSFLDMAPFSPASQFMTILQRMVHLPGLRGNPRRTYPKSAAGPHFPGTFENYVASVIAHWQNAGDSKLDKLGKALERMGLTWKVKAQPIDDTQVGIEVGRLAHSKRGGAHDLVSIADVGFGVSQSLPVVTALIAADENQVVYLEQPEIHLHPLAQRQLAHIVRDAAVRGVVVIVETHSALFLREIQTLVARGELEKQVVKLHWFQRGEDGCTTVSTAELGEDGSYGAWPEDFGETELKAEDDYLGAVEKRGR